MTKVKKLKYWKNTRKGWKPKNVRRGVK